MDTTTFKYGVLFTQCDFLWSNLYEITMVSLASS